MSNAITLELSLWNSRKGCGGAPHTPNHVQMNVEVSTKIWQLKTMLMEKYFTEHNKNEEFYPQRFVRVALKGDFVEDDKSLAEIVGKETTLSGAITLTRFPLFPFQN